MGSVMLKGVRKFFGPVEVIKDISLEVADRELVVFVGPSGCGKSTLLRMIAGLEDVDYGDIHIAGRDVTDLRPALRGVAMVFQNYALYPHMSAYDNMAYGLRRAGLPRPEVDARVHKAAVMLQIEHLLPRRPKAMSGGQRQRIAIGRAIVREPEVFLFDEPLSNLDATLRVEMRSQIAKLHRELKATMIFVTHDQVEAMTLADRIVVLNGGKIEQVGTPRGVYHHPANLFVAGFIGSPAMNILDVNVLSQNSKGLRLRIAGREVKVSGEFHPVKVGSSLKLGLRPERLHPCAMSVAHLKGEVTLAEHLGGETIFHLQTSEAVSLVLKTAGDPAARIGENMGVTFDVTGACVFGPDGKNLGIDPP